MARRVNAPRHLFTVLRRDSGRHPDPLSLRGPLLREKSPRFLEMSSLVPGHLLELSAPAYSPRSFFMPVKSWPALAGSTVASFLVAFFFLVGNFLVKHEVYDILAQ